MSPVASEGPLYFICRKAMSSQWSCRCPLAAHLDTPENCIWIPGWHPLHRNGHLAMALDCRRAVSESSHLLHKRQSTGSTCASVPSFHPLGTRSTINTKNWAFKVHTRSTSTSTAMRSEAVATLQQAACNALHSRLPGRQNSPGHMLALHLCTWESGPPQARPPWEGRGLSHVR